jgi:hypothetical protein
MDVRRRRKRINQIYRSVWEPVPAPGGGGGSPLSPDDHIRSARLFQRRGVALEDMPLFQTVEVVRGEDVAREYVRLLAEEAAATAAD